MRKVSSWTCGIFKLQDSPQRINFNVDLVLNNGLILRCTGLGAPCSPPFSEARAHSCCHRARGRYTNVVQQGSPKLALGLHRPAHSSSSWGHHPERIVQLLKRANPPSPASGPTWGFTSPQPVAAAQQLLGLTLKEDSHAFPCPSLTPASYSQAAGHAFMCVALGESPSPSPLAVDQLILSLMARHECRLLPAQLPRLALR